MIRYQAWRRNDGFPDSPGKITPVAVLHMTTTPSIESIRSKLRPIFDDDATSVFLFGSRADGSARANSDWDIGVHRRSAVAGHVMEYAREALESIRTLHSFDLVDFARTTPSFRKIALRRVVSLIGDEIDDTR